MKIDSVVFTLPRFWISLSHNLFYSALVLFEQSNCIDWIPVARKGNSISADFTEDTIRKRLEQCMFLLFSDNLAVVLGFLTLLDKYNIRSLS